MIRDSARPRPQSGLSLPETLKRLVGLLRGRRRGMATAIVLAVAAAILSLSPHIAVGVTLMSFVEGRAHFDLALLAVALGGLGVVLRHAAFGGAMLLSHLLAFDTLRDLRMTVARKLARVPLSTLQGQSKGKLRSVMLDDIDQLEDGIAHLIPELSGAIVTPVVAICAMALVDWRLAAVALGPTLLGLWMMGRLMARGTSVTRDYQRASAGIAEMAAEVADGRSTFRAFNQSDQAVVKAKAAFDAFAETATTWLRKAVAPGSASQILVTGNLLLVAPLGTWLAATDRIEAGALVLLLAITAGLGDLFAGIAGLAHRFGRQGTVLLRVEELLALEETPAVRRPGFEATALPADASVQCDRVSLRLGDRQVLDQVDFALPAGGFLALVGSSGAGKSTLAGLIARTLDPDEGCVRIGGVDLRGMDEATLHSQVATVFQEVFLFSGTIAENLALARADATHSEVVAAAKAAQAHDFIESKPRGYETVLGEGGYGLSGGERQRLSIARALLKDAPILILDEATAFADPENEAAIQQALTRLTAGRTLIVIAHRLQTVVHADEILLLDGGRIAERGRHDALIAANGRYAALWRDHLSAAAFRYGDPAPELPVAKTASRIAAEAIRR